MTPIPQLCDAEEATFWPWHPWPDFASWPRLETTLVVLPILGFADWGLGHPLDAEETVAMAVLRAAQRFRSRDNRLLVLPPLRFSFGPDPGCAFAVDSPTAHALIGEVVGSVAASGFRRVLLYISSPWSEEIGAAASRDLRIRHDLQIFRIALAALELDFHPVRSQDRRRLQTLITALVGREPEPPAPGDAMSAQGGCGEMVAPLQGSPLPLAAAALEGAATLNKSGARLAALLDEIGRHPTT